MLSSEALVIWMFRIAMNDPIMAARTAIQVVRLARFGSTAVCSGLAREAGSADIEADGAGFDMALSPGNLVRHFGCGGCLANLCLRFGLDGRNHRHARAQCDRRVAVAIERNLDRNPLHNLGEV